MPGAAGAVQPASARAGGPGSADKVIFFSSDGMRPDLMERYASEGAMPTYADMMEDGVRGDNGLVQAFPPNTGVGWNTLATGTYPSEHGSTNNTFHRTGEGNFNNRASAFTTGIVQADSLPQAAERAGKKVVAVEWAGARNFAPALQGPVIDFRSFFSNRGILLNYDLPGQPAGANRFGVSYQRTGQNDSFAFAPAYAVPTITDASGWSDVPVSYSTAKQTQFRSANSAFPASHNINRFFDLYIYDSTNDSTTNYDSALVAPSMASKNGTSAVTDLGVGEWADVKVTLPAVPASGSTPAIPERTAGFFLKLIELTPDLSQFRLYFTSIARSNATYNALGAAGSAAFEETLSASFPSSTAADFSPLEA